jgi:hypothetical protein
MSFWKELFKANNKNVNSITVFVLILSIPTSILAFISLIYHIFIKDKGLDGPAVQLFGILLAGMGGGGWAISRTNITSMVGMGGSQSSRPPGVRGPKAPPQGERDD